MSPGSAETKDLTRSSWPRKTPARAGAGGFSSGAVLDDRYLIVRLIGRGGMGRVVEVENLADGVHHALKYCDGSPLGKKRLIREARILAGFDHPHLLPVVGSNLSHDPPYFLMPLASSTLEAELGREVGDLSWACGAFRHVCLGVQALHQAGIVHRDLKPANILRLHDRYVVADLGTGKCEPRDSTVLTGTCAILGTLSYLAPEQLMPGGSRHADARTDIYQLGKVLYQMITRRSPAVIDASALPPGLSHIVQRATAARPPDRYPDVAELLEAVEAYHASPPQVAAGHPGRLVKRLSRTVKRLLEAGLYHGEFQQEILAALADLDRLEPAEVLGVFDSVPTGLLARLGRERPVLFVSPLCTYARSVEHASSRRHFEYADFVARRMKAVVQASRSPEVITASLKAILIASVVLNRYAAMAVLRRLLVQIHDVRIAVPVAEMLRAHRDYFHEIAPGLNADRLHPILRSVLDELVWIETVSF